MIARVSVRGREPNTHAAHTVQVAGVCGSLAKLAPQPGKVHVNGSVAAAVGLTPHVGQQLALGDHLTSALRQGKQEVELLTRQVDGRPVEADLARQWVDGQPTHNQGALGYRRAAAARTARSRASTCSI